MNLDAAINKTIIECQDRFSSNKMASVLYYNLFNDWAYNAYEITDTAIIDSERPYNDNPYDELVLVANTVYYLSVELRHNIPLRIR